MDCRGCALCVSSGLDSGFHWIRCPSNGQVRQLEGANGFLASCWVSFLLFCLGLESCSMAGSELAQRHCAALRFRIPFTELCVFPSSALPRTDPAIEAIHPTAKQVRPCCQRDGLAKANRSGTSSAGQTMPVVTGFRFRSLDG